MEESFFELKKKIINTIKAHPELPDRIREISCDEHMNMALNSKYPKVAMRHAKAILMGIKLSDDIKKIQGTYSDEMPKIMFDVKEL